MDFYLLIRCSLPTTKRNKSQKFDKTDSSKLIQEVFLYFISCGIHSTWLLSWWIIILLNMQHKKKKKKNNKHIMSALFIAYLWKQIGEKKSFCSIIAVNMCVCIIIVGFHFIMFIPDTGIKYDFGISIVCCMKWKWFCLSQISKTCGPKYLLLRAAIKLKSSHHIIFRSIVSRKTFVFITS